MRAPAAEEAAIRAFVFVALTTVLTAAAGRADTTLLDCRAVPEAEARLACYDGIVDRLRGAAPAGAKAQAAPPSEARPSAVAAPPTEPAPRPAAQPSADSSQAALDDRLFGRSSRESERLIEETLGIEQSTEQREKVASVSKNPYGKLIVVLENGQSWAQTDSAPIRLKPGDAVVVRKTGWDWFHLEKAGGKGRIRVRRID